MEVQVIKRNGTPEAYDPTKIVRVVKAAGLNDAEALTLADGVNAWLAERGKEEVTSVQVRDRVLVELQKINKAVAKKFAWYEMQRDKNFGLS